jgi:dUTPase
LDTNVYFELSNPASHLDAHDGIISFYLTTGLVLNSLDRKIVETGIRLKVDSSFILFVKSDSYLEKTNGIFTFPTVVPPIYIDEILLTLANLSSARMVIAADTKIAEACLIPFSNIILKQVNNISHLHK